MQDRFLFRGKRVGIGGWIEGSLIIYTDNDIVIKKRPESSAIGEVNVFNVDPATIGQCTGLKDKNGKLIFEGDILGGKTELVNLRGKLLGEFEESEYLVVWNEEKATFCTQRIKSSQHAKANQPEKEKTPTGTLHITLQYYPCIGNIHDTAPTEI